MREMVETIILGVFSDGTITRLELKTEPISVTIGREEPDQHFTIDKADVVDQEHMEEALSVLAEKLREYCVYSFAVNCVDGSKATLKI